MEHVRKAAPQFKIGPFELAELDRMLGRAKNNKATGPDDIPMEFFIWMDETMDAKVLNIINHWWNTSSFPAEKLKADIASIYKTTSGHYLLNFLTISNTAVN